ncbi:long-chain fatty acid--CoA ligase [Paraburkholderia jirisanensis]
MSNAAQHPKSPAVPAVEQGITNRILSFVHHAPASVLFVAGEQQWTASQVAGDALQLAHGMLASGVKPGDRVVIQLGNRPEAAVILLACLAVGAILVPLNPAYKPAEMDIFLRKLRPSLYFCEAPYYASVVDIDSSVLAMHHRFVVGEDTARTGLASWQTLKRDEGEALPYVDPHAPAVLLHTSGTTGIPKLVAHTPVTLAYIIERIESFGFNDSARMLVTLSAFYASGLITLLGCMAFGMTAVLLDGYDPDVSLDATEKYRCTAVFLTPHMANSFAQAQRARPRDVSALELSICGGDVCHPSIKQEFAELFGVPLSSAWGMTESIGTLSAGQTPGTYAPAADCTMLVDDDGHAVAQGVEGELLIRGNNLFKGYWQAPGQVDDGRRNGWFPTGDIMRQDHNGDLHYVARKKDLIINDGDNIAPAEVEQALLLHPAVSEAAVIGMQDVSLGQRVVGFVVLKRAAVADPQDILREVATRLAGYKVPERLLVVDEIPRNGMGKAIRPRLAERAAREMQVRDSV